MKQVARFLVLCIIGGMCYTQVELLARGFTYLPMSLIGGVSTACIGLLGRRRDAAALKMWQLSLLGMLIILDVEFISGCFFNLHLHMQLWNYSRNALNLDGQICAKYAAAWFVLVPSVLWVNDFLYWKLFDGAQPKDIWHYYQKLMTLR